MSQQILLKNGAMQVKYSAYDMKMTLQRDAKHRKKLARQLAVASGHTAKLAEKFLSALVHATAKELLDHGVCLLPKLLKFRLGEKAARENSTKIICGRVVPLRALLRHNIVHCRITKGFSAALHLTNGVGIASALPGRGRLPSLLKLPSWPEK